MNAYQYVVLRCVPRPDREEFLNVGAVLYCHATDFLAAASYVDRDRLAALAPDLDPTRLEQAVAFVEAVCAGAPTAGVAGRQTLSHRFGFLKAPRSTVLQSGPVHGGLTSDPADTLTRLLSTTGQC